MGKFFIKFFSISLLALFIIIIFLSYYGLETSRFNTLIKSKANEVNNNIRLEFEETKIHLNIKESNLIVKLHDPKVLIKNDEVDLSKLDLFISLKSFFSSRFSLTRAEIAFEKNLIINKPEAVLAKVLCHLISIRAQVKTNPISGEVINDQPIVVSAWKSDSFNLQEGCETPSDQEVITKAFSSAKEAVNYFLKNIGIALETANN